MIIPAEPTDEMIEAAAIAIGIAPKIRAVLMDSVRKNRGTAHEPGIVPQIRAVLAILRGVPLDQIKRGYKGP